MSADIYTTFRDVDVPIIDADAHVQEPPNLWIERAPARLKDRAPRVEHRDNGDWWIFDDGKAAQPLGLTASAGRSVVEYRRDGVRHDELRPGMSEPKPRLADLDADGVWAHVLYPSVTLAGAKTYSDDSDRRRGRRARVGDRARAPRRGDLSIPERRLRRRAGGSPLLRARGGVGHARRRPHRLVPEVEPEPQVAV